MNSISELQTAFAETPGDEDHLANLCGRAFEEQVPGVFSFLLNFLERFPHSLHPLRAFVANILSGEGHFDSASNEARIYLRTLKDHNQLQSTNPMLQEGLARCILPATAAYTEVGARSYSLRIIHWGSTLIKEPYWQDIYSKENALLQEELQDSARLDLDQKWEAFFADGSNAELLHALCLEKGFEALAQRISILATEPLYTGNGVRPFEEEFLLLLLQDSNTKAFALR